jgi:hypothetical protein
MQVLIFNVLSWSKLIDLQLGAVRGALAPLDVYRAVGNHGDIVELWFSKRRNFASFTRFLRETSEHYSYTDQLDENGCNWVRPHRRTHCELPCCQSVGSRTL